MKSLKYSCLRAAHKCRNKGVKVQKWQKTWKYEEKMFVFFVFFVFVFCFFTDIAISFTTSVINPIKVMIVMYQETCFLISRELYLYQEKLPF